MKLATTLFATAVASLLSLGIVVLYSASMGPALVTKQLIALGIGLVLCVTAVLVDYRHLKNLTVPMYFGVVLLLVLVVIPGIGTKAGGARRWLQYGGASFQPSDLAKIVLVICLARYVELNHRRMHDFKTGVLIPFGLAGVFFGAIMLEPDFGTTALMGAVTVAMLLVGGVRWIHMTPVAALAAIGFALKVYFNPNRTKRVFSWINLEETKTGTGYQVWQSIVALGSGGTTGIGLGIGRQKLGWVPEHHTDFIFSVVGEELGLAATLGVVIAFVIVVVCGIYIAWRARDSFGFMLAGGLTLLIGLQAFINIGVVTGALPNKGLPLPFISFGGSNLMMMLLAVGLILSVALRAGGEAETDEEDASLVLDEKATPA